MPSLVSHDWFVPRKTRSRPSAEKVKPPPSPVLVVLAANLSALKVASADLDSQGKIGARAGINQRTVGRILNMEHEPTVGQLGKLAAIFGLEPWKLLVPGLNPKRHPRLADAEMLKAAEKFRTSINDLLDAEPITEPAPLDDRPAGSPPPNPTRGQMEPKATKKKAVQ